MEIISWDVGVCNLAYCRMRYDRCQELPLEILEWGKVNLCIRYRECQEEGCVDQAINADKACTHWHCKRHKKSKEQLMPKIRNSKNTDELRFALYEFLETKQEWHNVNFVAIENQPALKNPGMKTMACAIYDYFMMRCNILRSSMYADRLEGFRTANDTEPLVNHLPTTIRFVSPMNKTRLAAFIKNVGLEQLKTIPPEIDSITPKYKRTKALGIWLCSEILGFYGVENLMEYHTKQDDLADALLQGLTVIENF